MATVEAKGKVKARHRMAIEKFIEWDVKHPNATRGARIRQFNMLVDSAALAEKVK